MGTNSCLWASLVAKMVKNVVKNSACNVGDLGSIPGLGRSPVEVYGNPLHYSCLENPMDRGAWWATAQGVSKSPMQPRGMEIWPLAGRKALQVRRGPRPEPVTVWTATPHFHFSLSCIGEGSGNPLQYSCLENPMYGGAP